jgi:NADPH:quinone reductase-like Zn-dependent oxidoreductase
VKAVLIHEHGGLDKLTIGEFPTPEPGPGQVRVRLHAAALNQVDLLVRRGLPGLKPPLPHITGSDGAGKIDAVGDGVDPGRIGQRVVINGNLSCGHCRACLAGRDNQCTDWNLLGETVRGTLAEYVVIPAINALPLPDDFGYEQAAAAGLVYLTAWHSLVARGRVRPGETVLIVGASGGVNTASIQIAKLAGATVFVVGSSADKLELARSLGADVLINRQEEDWSKAAYLASERRGVDIVIDNVGKGTMPSSLRAACKGGRILTVGCTGGAHYELDHRYLFAKHLSVIGSTMGTHADFQTAMDLVFAGTLTPVIDRSYPFDEIRQAEARLEAGEQMGKITIVI